MGKNNLWYLDTDGTTANANTGFEARKLQTQRIGEGGGAADASKDVNFIIPLNRYSLFEELEGNMLPPMQPQFDIELNDGDELIQRANAADAGRVVVNRPQLMVPKLTPKDSMYDKFVSSFLKQTE